VVGQGNDVHEETAVGLLPLRAGERRLKPSAVGREESRDTAQSDSRVCEHGEGAFLPGGVNEAGGRGD